MPPPGLVTLSSSILPQLFLFSVDSTVIHSSPVSKARSLILDSSVSSPILNPVHHQISSPSKTCPKGVHLSHLSGHQPIWGTTALLSWTEAVTPRSSPCLCSGQPVLWSPLWNESALWKCASQSITKWLEALQCLRPHRCRLLTPVYRALHSFSLIIHHTALPTAHTTSPATGTFLQ